MTHDADAEFRDDLAPAARPESPWAVEKSLPLRLVAEAVGTAFLITVGVGAVIMAPPAESGMSVMPALAWGGALFVLMSLLLRVSGAHLNPAVTVGLWAAGRFPGRDVAPYVLAHVTGSALASMCLTTLLGMRPGALSGRAGMSVLANGWGAHSPWQVSVWTALVAEAVAVAAFVTVMVRMASCPGNDTVTPAPASLTGAAGPVAVTFALLVTLTAPLTNGALSPARATAIALASNTWALGQLWAWWLAPAVGALVAGLTYRAFGPTDEA